MRLRFKRLPREERRRRPYSPLLLMFIVWIFITDAVLALIVSSVGAADESSTIFYLLGFGFVALMTYRLYRNIKAISNPPPLPRRHITLVSAMC